MRQNLPLPWTVVEPRKLFNSFSIKSINEQTRFVLKQFLSELMRGWHFEFEKIPSPPVHTWTGKSLFHVAYIEIDWLPLKTRNEKEN